MKSVKQKLFISLIFLFVLGCSTGLELTKTSTDLSENYPAKKYYYGIEVNNVLCGYFEAEDTPVTIENRDFIKGNTNIFFMVSALGSEFNTEMKIESLIDSETKKCAEYSIDIDAGTTKRNTEITVEDNVAFVKSSDKSEITKIILDDDVLFDQEETFFRVKNDFVGKNQTEMKYRILQVMEGEIQESIFRKTGNETIELAGRTFATITLEEINQKSGLRTEYWLAPDEDYFVMFKVLNRRIFLADHTVADKIKVANMDETLLTKTNESISDIPAISYMKLNVKIQPTGVKLTPEALNIPGQKFTGTVKDNLIEGILEIDYPRYNGINAPSFPAVYSSDQELKRYLEPESRIQSDDPVLITKAKEITKGSKDSWEAATRITKWVAENISYAIPGGGEARKTFDIRAGECGAHSMLVAAFCRAVGIPSRVVWGAMYIPNKGGGFGQHGWNEIYMGNERWIPVDATAFENDFVDAGHIRIAELEYNATAFNGKEIEILDYKLLSDGTNTETTDSYASYLGKYTNFESGKTFEVLEKDGNLSVDIPGQMILPFNDANEQSRWYCKLNGNLYLEFTRDDEKDINQMVLHQLVSMTKKSSPEKISDEVPAELTPYLGKYLFAQVNKEFEVICLNESLAVKEPDKEKPVALQSPDENGGWLDEYNKYTIYFDMNDSGDVILLKLDAANKFIRREFGTPIVERTIDSLGLDAGLKKYRELENHDPDIYIFSESNLNILGYKYLNAEKFTEAIEVFKLNVEAYPKSFNVYGSLAEAYRKDGQKELATINYTKSLELNPDNKRAAEMLNELN